MKRFSILLIIFTICTGAFAQVDVNIKDDNVTVKKPVFIKRIDFLNDTRNLRDDTVKYNLKYKYVLTNINRFIYKETSAEQKGENLNVERPDIMKGIKLPGFLNTQKIGPTRSIASEEEGLDKCKCENVENIIGKNKELREAYRKITDNNNTIIKLTDTFNTNSGVNRNLVQLKENIAMPWDQIRDKKIKLIKDSLSIVIDSIDLNDALTAIYKNIPTKVSLLFEDSIKHNAELLLKNLNGIIELNKECLFDYWGSLRCLDSCKSKNFIAEENKYLSLKECIEQLQKFINGIKSDLSEVETTLQNMNKAIADGQIGILQNNYNLLAHENFELELESFIADKDIHQITFTAKTEGPLVFGKPANRIIKINAVTYGGWKIDYSTGAFYNMGSNKFLGPEYYFENRASDTSKAVIEAQRTKKAMLSIGALLHIYPRINFGIRPGLALGVSTTLGFDVLNFHGGLSLLFGKPGKANRVILSGGLTLREVSLLDSRFNLNEFRKDYGDAVPTYKNFPVSGGFISFTYNLAGINK